MTQATPQRIVFHEIRRDPAPAAATTFPADDLDAMIERAETTLTRLLRKGMPVCVSWSAGKDSSTVLNLLLGAASKMAEAGEALPPIVVTHADTLIENPEMVAYARNEMAHVAAFARRYKLDVAIEIASPNLADQWAVRVIGGRALPPFPGTNRDCSKDWKVKPMQRLRKSVLRRLQQHSHDGVKREPVVLLGTRYDESVERARNMTERGESDIEVRRGIDQNGKPSHLFLSPIAFWTSDDVWGYLGMARSSAIRSYSSFDDTFRVYADAMGTSCVIVAEDMSKSMKASKACGARHGCSLCTAVGKDQSMENMLATDERYGYMKGLNQLRNFITNTRWDMSRRSWLGRTIDRGHVRIAPDAYSPGMMEELLRYSLTLDVEEQTAAHRAGRSPRFQLVSLEQLFAIDAMWSLQAYHRPYHALKIYDDIYRRGQRYPVPDVAPVPRPKSMEKPKYLFVGQDWDEGRDYVHAGLRSYLLEMVKREGDGCMGLKKLESGLEVMDINTGSLFEIDSEGAGMFIDFELERALRDHDNPALDATMAYRNYVQLGFLSVCAGKESEIDYMLRRASFKCRQGIAGQVNHEALLKLALSAEEAGMTTSGNGKRRTRGAAGSRSVGVTDLSIDQIKPADSHYHRDMKTDVASARRALP